MKLLLLAFSLLILSIATNAQVKDDALVTVRSRLLDAPAVSGRVQKEIEAGTKVRVLDFKDDWFVVRIDDAVGWIASRRFQASVRYPEHSKPNLWHSKFPANTGRTKRT